MSHALHLIFKAIKRTRTIPDELNVGAVTLIHKKEDKHIVENYTPVTLLNFSGKLLERCLYEHLYEHFMIFDTNSQNGFIKGRSVSTNMLRYLHYVHETLDKYSKTATTRAFYTDFAKAFDKVPHHVLSKKN